MLQLLYLQKQTTWTVLGGISLSPNYGFTFLDQGPAAMGTAMSNGHGTGELMANRSSKVEDNKIK